MIIGIMVGTSVRATRDIAVPVVSPEELARWATEQAQLAIGTRMMEVERSELAEFICACGGDTGKLPIGWGESGPMTIGEVKDWARPFKEIILTSHYDLRPPSKDSKELQLRPNVLVITDATYRYYLINDAYTEDRWPSSQPLGSLNGTQVKENTIKGHIIRTLAETWGTTVEKVLEASVGGDNKNVVVANRGEKEVAAEVEVIKRPKA
jgi:hypothetical protein